MSIGLTNVTGLKNLPFKLSEKLITDILSAHSNINTFSTGDIFEVEMKEVTYPLAHLSIESASYDTGTLTYSFQLIVMDLVSKDESNESYVLSSTLETIGDVLSKLKNADITTITDSRNHFRIQDNVTCEPFTERFDNEVAGWAADFEIETAFDFSACEGAVL